MATVLVIGDTHCPVMRQGYISFLKRVADRYSPSRVVHIGDLVDWNSISYHEKHPSLSSASEEYHKAKKQVAQLHRAFPKADWLIGNHDSLTHRQGITAGLPPEVLRDYNELWEVNWKVHDRFSELIIDGVVYMHGEGPGGKYAHVNRAIARMKSVVMGHCHSNAGVQFHATPDDRIFGLAVGCGVDNDALQFLYGKPTPRKPLLGCGVVVNGKQAYFEPWTLPCR